MIYLFIVSNNNGFEVKECVYIFSKQEGYYKIVGLRVFDHNKKFMSFNKLYDYITKRKYSFFHVTQLKIKSVKKPTSSNIVQFLFRHKVLYGDERVIYFKRLILRQKTRMEFLKKFVSDCSKISLTEEWNLPF